MEARVGDRLVIKGRRVGEGEKSAEILEVRGKDGGPPYVVRWSDDGREGLVFPGSDASIERGRKKPVAKKKPPAKPKPKAGAKRKSR